MSATLIAAPQRSPGRPSQQRAPSRHDTLRERTEIPQVLEKLTSFLLTKQFSTKDLFAVRLAVEEALVNAIEHGHRGNPRKVVRVHYVFLEMTECFLVTVQDQGEGFDPTQIPDPRKPENLSRADGRGILLMKAYMTWVRFGAEGCCITMCKRRS